MGSQLFCRQVCPLQNFPWGWIFLKNGNTGLKRVWVFILDSQESLQFKNILKAKTDKNKLK